MWWEMGLRTGDISNTPFQVLRELYEELLKLTDLAKSFNHSLLIALAYSDDNENDSSLWFGTVDSEYSIEEYLTQAQRTLAERPELRQLGRLIESKLGSFT